jgi:hypothetical protein
MLRSPSSAGDLLSLVVAKLHLHLIYKTSEHPVDQKLSGTHACLNALRSTKKPLERDIRENMSATPLRRSLSGSLKKPLSLPEQLFCGIAHTVLLFWEYGVAVRKAPH